MKEEFISFKTAKLAKERGFNIVVTNAHYDRKGEFWEGLFEGEKAEYLAPTQSLLQKWLREEHNINLYLKPIYGGDLVGGKQISWMCYTSVEDETINNIPSISISENTYEEALENGLAGALKLI